MSKTFGAIVEEVLSNTRGFTAASDQVTSLSAPMTDTATTGTVDDLDVVGAGIIEIGDEQMWVKSVDPASGTFTLLPQGRGWAGTTAVSHDTGDTVYIAPAIPRGRVKQAVLDCIANLWPTLYAVASTEFTQTDLIKDAWEIPAAAERILDVRYKDAVGNWRRVRAWEVERSSNTDDFASGVALVIRQYIPSASTIRVIYGKKPEPLVNESDLFTATGFDEQIADLVVLGVMAQLLPMFDVSRLQVTHVAADEMDQPRPLGSAKGLADSFRSLYNARLQEQQTVLNRRYPARIHITR